MPLTRVRTGGITDANVTTAKVANNAIGTSQLALANQGYEHIETRTSASNGQRFPSGESYFTNVFSNNYVAYKVIVGYWANLAANGDGGDHYFRFINSSGTSLNTSDYQYSNTRQRANNDGYLAVSGQNADLIQIYRDSWTGGSGAGGFSGEINIFNVNSVTLNSVDLGRGDVYRPLMTWDFAGYDTGENQYVRQSGFGRYNVSASATTYTGFTLGSTTGNERLGTHFLIYGLRKPV